ncbi:MAG: hypothetical protein VYA34_00830 [Myxococcota bacterium]|nr:hypothetical protein [Myxococcota bacterium]
MSWLLFLSFMACSWFCFGSDFFLLNIYVSGSYFGRGYIYAVWVSIAGPLNLICTWFLFQRDCEKSTHTLGLA